MSWTGQSWAPEQPRFVADLTGNGKVDIVGFGLDGIWTSLNNGDGTFQPPNMVLAAFNFHTGWQVEKHPRFVADLTGDGRADILGFGDGGVWTSVNNGDGTFQPAQFVIGDLGYNQGWRVDQHPRFLADLTGNGRADVVGFGNDGVWTALSNGDGTFQPAKLVLAGFNLNQGWLVTQNPRFLADVNGDGKADIVGFGNDGVWTALGNGDGTFQPAKLVLDGFNPSQGWQVDRHPRMLADLNGDRYADIVGFGDAGVWSSLSDGSGGFHAAVYDLADLGYNNGWRVENHLRFAVDVTGDGKADIIGFGDAGVWVSVTGGGGLALVLAGFCYNQGWMVDQHPRFIAELNGDGKADIIGFGDAGVWIALGNGDGTFQPAAFVLADFGYHSGPVLQSITLSLHTQDHLDDNTLLHIFVKNRPSDSSATEGSTDYIGNFMAYQERDADWYSTNPYLGFAQGASKGQRLDDNSTTQINIPLRSQPIPLEEILLPVVNIHILTHGNNTWTFDYTITFTLDDGRQFPWSSNTNGITGIILDQDNLNYSGICQEIQPVQAPTKPVTDAVLTAATIEFNTHNDDKNSSTTLNIHVVNRLNATSSLDISVMNDVDSGQAFPDSGDTYKRVDLTVVSNSIYLRDIVLPVVYINIGAGTDKWIFDYRVTFIFGQGQPYSWTAFGIVLDQDRHKHMGVYNGRSFPSLARPQANLTPLSIKRNKSISLAYVQQKLQELFNSRQGLGDLNPIVKLRLDNTGNQGDQVPQSYLDTQWIEPAPPPPDGAPQPPLGVTYGHSPSVLGQLEAIFGKIGVQLNDINSQALTLNVNSGNNQTPLALNLQFETGGPQEITGTLNIDVTVLEITVQLTLRYEAATNSVDLFGWLDDINGITFTPLPLSPPAPLSYQIAGTFLGTPLSGTTVDPDAFKGALVEQVVDVVFTTSKTTDPGGIIQKALRGGVFNKLNGSPDTITKVTLRQSINATLNTWLMGGVIQSGNTELVPYPNPCELVSPGGQHPEFPVTLKNDVLTLNYFGPANSFVYQTPSDWGPLSQGTLANIDHIVVLTQENRSFDHMLGYLSLPYEKGGMSRTDVDGLKGGEFNMLNGRKCEVFRFAPGDTIFSPGPSNSVESVALSINGEKLTDPIMGSFVLAHANDFGPATAPRVMGYHTADNVPTFDALARDFAICQRWFSPHPGSTFPNRFYELTGRPSIDPWGAWDYDDSLLPVFTDTIFDHLTDQGVSWKYFENGYSFLRTFERYTFDSVNLVNYDDPIAGFEQLAKTGNLPSVTFVDPHFVALPPGSTDDEAPSDIRESQPVIRRLVEALVTSPAWNKTLLIITYDEHGGFYDHVPPPAAAKVSDELLPTTGVRVPTFFISPWVTGGTVIGSDEIWFDHTSILKTISRRFMSANPPYMGARYAAANDLSAVLATKMRSGPFRPFIPYTVTYGASKKCLDVEGDRLAPGTLLWQYDPNPTPTQQFSFEDEGEGYVYIRTTTGGLYLTVDAGLVTNASQYGIKLDMKYPSGGSGATNPNYQRWIFNVPQVSVIGQQAGTFSNAAFPGMLLHPQGESPNSGTPVVLETLSRSSPISSQYEWVVSNPALSGGLVNAPPGDQPEAGVPR